MAVDGEPEAYRDDNLKSISISPRERLARIEEMLAKIDLKIDFRFDQIDKRVWALEVNTAPVAKGIAEDVVRLDNQHELLRTKVDGLNRKVTYAAGAAAMLVFISDLTMRLFVH